MRSRHQKSIISFILLLIALSIGAFIYVDNLLDTNAFYDGVTIDGISMDGLTKESARETLERMNQPRLNNLSIELVHESKSWKFGHEDMDASMDIKEKIDQAYDLAREGNILERFFTVGKLKKQGYAINTELTYNASNLIKSIEQIASEIKVEPIDATVAFNPDDEVKFNISPEKDGYYLDVDETMDQVKQALNQQADKVIKLSPQLLSPKVTAKDFEGKLDKVVTFGTDLSKSAPDRTTNVVKAAMAFNGMVVSPGQVVSFNETTGERTLEKGYKHAAMILNKRFVDVPGGGVSQTSTTLYNTVIRAGLEVVERTRHSLPSSYIDKGLDTTVNLPLPGIDLKFRNNRDNPIYLRAFHANKKIYFEIYGGPIPNNEKYEFYSETYETISAPPPEIIKDQDGKYVEYEDEEYVHVESRKGYKVRVYRQIFENGSLVKEETFDTHFYRPVKGKVYVGVKKKEIQQPDEIEPADEIQRTGEVQPPSQD
ncbi:MAG TPA: VanW family protein [Clostridia bacterium]|nr:VanW family protein [Clostridia bacterium]